MVLRKVTRDVCQQEGMTGTQSVCWWKNGRDDRDVERLSMKKKKVEDSKEESTLVEELSQKG